MSGGGFWQGPAWSRWWRAAAALTAAGALLWGWQRWDAEAFQAWLQKAGPVPFFLALAILPAAGVPTTPFYILAGALYGVTVGLAGSAASLAVNLLLCHWIVHSGLRQWLQRRLERSGRGLPVLQEGRAVKFTLLVKLAPGVPAFVKNYLVVLAGVPFPIYFWLSFAVTMAYAAAFVVMGESVWERDFTRLGWAAGVLAALGALVWGARRLAARRER